jgi:carboxyl-terminal processing protease
MRRSTLLCSFFLVLFLAGPIRPGLAVKSSGDRFEPLKRFSQVMDMVERYYVRDVNRDELVDGAVKGMLQELDPHSSYMNKDEFEEMQVSTSGEFSGIGIEISMRNGKLVVVSPIEDTPAHQAGLKSGDIIIEIDGQSTEGITLVDAVKKIRGPKGSKVSLTVLHKDNKTPDRLSITRDTIPILSVKSETLEPGYGYIRITKFNEHTTDELNKAIKDFKKKGELKGLVLDMRNNPGGLLDQAVSVADAFLGKGLVVYIQGRNANSKKEYTAKLGAGAVNTPMVALINAGSASASEIVAGALQDHKRALLIGEPSFGKGSVQTIIPLSDGGGVKLTTALYYTPSGRSIQAEGIVPDMHIPLAARTEADELTLREKDLNNHLMNASGKKEKARVKDKDKKPENEAERVKKMLEVDNQLRIGLQFVKKQPPAALGQ